MRFQGERLASWRWSTALRGAAVTIITYFVVTALLIALGVDLGAWELLLVVVAALVLGVRAARKAERRIGS